MQIIFIRKNSINKPDSMKKREFESFLARIVAKFGAKYFYGLEDTNIIEEKKPRFATDSVFFSISHSHDIVAVAFDDSDIGFDIELMKDRDFECIAKRMNWKNIVTKQDFYQAWTGFEAQVKQKSSNIQSFLFEDYAISISSSSNKNIEKQLKIYELKFFDMPSDNNFSSEIKEIDNKSSVVLDRKQV